MGGWIAKLEIETRQFDANVERLILLSKKSIPEIIKDSAITFIQSAAKATPTAKKKKRDVTEIIRNSEKGKEYKQYKVKMFHIEKTSSLFFNKESKAKKYTAVTYWGLNKMGWLGNLLRLGKTPKMTNSRNLTGMISKITGGAVQDKEITITNRVKKIGSWAAYTQKEGLFKANIRLKHQIKKLSRELKNKWRK